MIAARRRVWIEERMSKAGKARYVLRWYDDEGRCRSRGAGGNRRVADGDRSELEYALNSGLLKAVRAATLAEFAAEHVALMTTRRQPATVVDQAATLELLKAFVGEVWLDDISPATAERFVADRLAQVAPATANKNLRTLKAIFGWAVKRGYLRESPWAGLRPEREPEKVKRVLTFPEVMALLEACPSKRWRAMVLMGVTTGARLGELRNLEWRDVDFERGWITVGNKAEWRTKSGKVRRMPLVRSARDALEAMGVHGDGRVFRTADGEQIRNNVQRDFLAIVARAKVGEKQIQRCTFHDLRRTFASGLANAGQTAQLVQEMCGHASYETTAAAYVNIHDDSKRAAADGLPWSGITTLSPLRRTVCRKARPA